MHPLHSSTALKTECALSLLAAFSASKGMAFCGPHCLQGSLPRTCVLSSRDHDIQYQCRSWLQTLAVAVHNHYKRVRHETSRRRLQEQQAASAQNGGAVASFIQSGKVNRSILETTTGPPPTPHSAQTAPHSYPHDRFPFPPTPEAGRTV